MALSASGEASRARGHKGGWVEAGLFVVTIAVLNLSYAWAHEMSVHPIAFLVYAMPVAAATLIAVTGPGPHALRIMLAPQSWLVGIGIIGMEAFYFLLLWYVTPAEASVLTRFAIPVAMLMGLALGVRHPSVAEGIGAAIVTGGIVWLIAGLHSASISAGVALALGCALVMSMRTFATEFHPWNRRAGTVIEKMRVTGLVLAITSGAGALLVAVLVAMAGAGLFDAGRWLPTPAQLLHVPTFAISLLVGAGVLTAMQYLAFSSVVKIGSENFIAVTAFTPLTTLLAQELGAAGGLLAPMPVDWRIVPSMAVVIAGVFVLLVGARRAAR